MSFHLCFIAAVTGVVCAGVAFAGEVKNPKGVVELFTAQGCSSCPPADAAFAKLVSQGDVIALSYHVDYWNYLGWADTLSSKENTERQYGYAKTLGRSGVYTPQVIVNGRDHVKGKDVSAMNGKVRDLNDSRRGLSIPISATMSGDEIEIEIGSGQGQADVIVAYFTRHQKVDITKGENTGKQMEYWHAVYDVQSVGSWNGQNMVLKLPGKLMGQSKKDGCAILLQTSGPDGEPAAILGAAMLMAEHKKP